MTTKYSSTRGFITAFDQDAEQQTLNHKIPGMHMSDLLLPQLAAQAPEILWQRYMTYVVCRHYMIDSMALYGDQWCRFSRNIAYVNMKVICLNYFLKNVQKKIII